MYLLSCVYNKTKGWTIHDCWFYHGRTPRPVRLVTFQRTRQIWLNSNICVPRYIPCNPLRILKRWQQACRREVSP